MSTKRYRFYIDPQANCFCEMEEIADGSYVEHEDYAELEAQLKDMKRELDEGHAYGVEQNLRAKKAEAQLDNVCDNFVEGNATLTYILIAPLIKAILDKGET